MQMLIGDEAILPSIMAEVDNLPKLSPCSASARAQGAKVRLLGVLERLSQWEDSFADHIISSLISSPEADKLDCHQMISSTISFPSLLAANIHTHLWAFRILCLVELQKLDMYKSETQEGTLVGLGSCGDYPTRISSLSTLICHSIEYLLQDQMSLHGPASAIFPLRVAYNALRKDPEVNEQKTEAYRQLFNRVYLKGSWAMPFFEMEKPI
jgi:hypothetical protein